MVRLTQQTNETFIPANHLKDGQLAIVVDERFGYTGRIVQKTRDRLVALGRTTGDGWSAPENVTLLVRILENGELIEVFDNE